MDDAAKTKQELIQELALLRQQIELHEQAALKHRQTEEALRESEAKFRTITENMLDCVSLVDMNIQYQYVTPSSYKETLGYDPEEMIGISGFSLTHPDDRERVLNLYEENIKQGVSEGSYETRLRHKDGHYVPMETRMRVLKDPQGMIVGGILAARDITQRRQLEKERREAEEKYRILVENSNEAIFVAQDWKLVFVNTMANHMSGWSAEELLGRPFIDFIHPDDRNAVVENYFKRLKGEDFLSRYPFRFIIKDGRIRWAEISAVLIEWAGRPATLNLITDITERRQMAEEKQVLEEHLQRAEKMEAIGTLAGGIAHDFNNLLMGIQGYASLALLTLDPSDPNYKRLKRIEEQVQSGADLTRQLLGFARGGRYEVKPADMNDIIKKTTSLFGRTKKEISIHRKYAKELWTVEADRGQMEQVFMNLYVNAWQAMPGGGEIHLETQNIHLNDEQALPCAVKPGKYVKITITDTGTGMDKKTMERIFDPFFTTKALGRGTGLGLATVYGIITGHQGMIHVDSEPGHGTTFTIYLPATEKNVTKEKPATANIDQGTETILLVDDEKTVLEVSRELLKSLGYRVYATGSGQEAIAVYMEKRNEIDLVILDMIMPGISGGETFDRLREINPGLKVLLSSGYSLNGEAKSIMDRGCNGFLQKPFQLEQLSRKVREVLN